jgi:hypothetical protein
VLRRRRPSTPPASGVFDAALRCYDMCVRVGCAVFCAAFVGYDACVCVREDKVAFCFDYRYSTLDYDVSRD